MNKRSVKLDGGRELNIHAEPGNTWFVAFGILADEIEKLYAERGYPATPARPYDPDLFRFRCMPLPVDALGLAVVRAMARIRAPYLQNLQPKCHENPRAVDFWGRK